MNTQMISSRLRNHDRKDLAIKESFLRFQSHHFDTSWDRLLETFIEQEGRVNLFSPPYDVTVELQAFLAQREQPFDHLGAYTYHFAQAGLSQLPQLTSFEKDMVVLLATYNMAVRFQLLDSEGTYYGVSLSRLLHQMEHVDFINVSKVANNLADRISRELDVFILEYEPPVLAKPELEFDEDELEIRAVYGQVVATLDKRNLVIEHLPAYQDLNLTVKSEIIAQFDQRKKELSQENIARGQISFEEEHNLITAYLAQEGIALSQFDRQTGRSIHLEAYKELSLVQKFEILSYFDQLEPLLTTERAEKPTQPTILVTEEENEGENRGHEPEGIKKTFSSEKLEFLTELRERYSLTDENIAFLKQYPQAQSYQLEIVAALLFTGVEPWRLVVFLNSSLNQDDLVFIAREFSRSSLTAEEIRTFESYRQFYPEKAPRELLEKVFLDLSTNDQDLTKELREIQALYPEGTSITYQEQVFEVLSIEEEVGKIKLELGNDYTDLIEEDLVFYVTSPDELAGVLTPVSKAEVLTEENEKVASDDGSIDLFSFLDDEPSSSLVLEQEVARNTETEAIISTVPDEELARDFVFPEELTDFYPKGTRAKVEANLAAIRLVKMLEQTKQLPTVAQQEILAKYVGWGGLANSFFDEHNPQFEVEREALKSLVSDKEYSDMKQSSLTAYYTDPDIIRKIWEKLEADGFTGGRILDPSMGTGNFFAAMPRHLKEKSELYGVELDGITGAIARFLQPSSTVFIKGFEDIPFQTDSFDLVISNIPFGNFRIADSRYDKPYMIHDYFVKKSLDVVRDAGQVVLISSTGTMDKRVDNVLQDVKDSAVFLGGVRLPDTAFQAIAGTNVTTDIIFFQKDLDKQITTEEVAFSGAVRYAKDDRIWLNPYFDGEANPQVLGSYEVKNFNGGTLSVKGNTGGLLQELTRALNNVTRPSLNENVFLHPQILVEKQLDQPIPPSISEKLDLYSFGYEGNTIYYRDREGIRIGSKTEEISYYVNEEGQFQAWDSKHSQVAIDRFLTLDVTDEEAVDVYLSPDVTKSGRYKGYHKKTVFYEGPLSEKEVSRIKGMVDIRDTYQKLIELQKDYDYDRAVFEKTLAVLNEQYDRFVKRHGFLNNNTNRNLFDSDDKYSLLASLEDEYIDPVDKKVKYQKSLAFERALVRPDRVLNHVTSAKDALNTSLADGRGVDSPFMLSLYPGRSKEELIQELGDLILLDPEMALMGNMHYISRQDFLSGDILTRLEQVDELQRADNHMADWEKYQLLLEEVKPPRVGFADIAFQIGSRWIPNDIYGQFAYEVILEKKVDLEDSELSQVIDVSPLDGTYTLTKTFTSNYVSAREYAMGVKGSRYDCGRKIFENLLNSNQPTINQTIEENGKKRMVTDVERTSLLRSRENDMQEQFKEYILASPEAQALIEETYNNLYNRTVSKTYDGSYLEIDGLAQHITLRPHQKNAIQRIVEEKRALLAHEVGSGKTLTMLGAGFKLKELGMIHKPLYVVPSSLTAQFGQEILKFFPTKKVFVTTKKDFAKARRKQFVSRIITGDYDAIVIGDSQFEKIPMSKSKQEEYIVDKLDELREIYASSDNSYTVKESERAIRSLEQRLEDLQKLDRDSFIEFENLGIDCLFVDEAHHFKNIRPVTGLGNVAGITNITAKKNIDMEMKVRQVQSEHNHRHVIFATGTPVSNSISELYTMMKYVQPDVLERYQVSHFDSWVGAFGQIENAMELAPTGDKYQPKKRFKKFVNLPELMRIYKETADIQTSDMLNLPVPKARIIPVESELTDSQRYYLEELVGRSEDIKNGLVDPTVDNMLKIVRC